MGGDEEWRKGADTHKMEASKRPPGQHPGGVLHQRKALPYSYTTITITGLLLTAAMGYLVLYVNKKPQATATDVAKVTLGAANPQDTRPHK